MREREFIIKVQWLPMLKQDYKGLTLIRDINVGSYNGDCHISIPNITNEDLVAMKLRHPGFRYREV